MPAIILRNVCGKLGDDFKFDMIAGTSVGALVASSFALGKIDHFINDYNTLSKKIFTSNWSYWNPLNWFGIIRGLRGPAYRVDSKERAIRDFIGTEDENTYSLDKIGTRLLVPFYLQQNSCVAFYKNYDEISNKNVHKYSLVDSLMATTAAPTFFNPHIFQGLDGCRYEGIDGGAFAINPALVVYQESRLLFPQSRIVLLSLGTGDHNYIDNDFESTDRGNLFWAKKYPTVTNCAMTTYTHQFLTERSSADKLDYFRVNPHLVQHLCNSMDNTSPAHIETLKTYTNKTIAESSSDFYKFVERAKNIKKL
ncbi:hypothetical protein FACS189449_08870 [Alphaproteobacteria bacterium]|nr:hypothetical protein FACS189449_08870 [Alphaproteobacteria bacterium]